MDACLNVAHKTAINICTFDLSLFLMTQKLPKLFLSLLGFLLVLNLVQSYFTQLINDEAYYWYYAQNLDWGYFDHPPMVAFMIVLGSSLFSGELGVRFVSCLLSVGTYILLWLLIDNPKKKEFVPHFFLLLFGMTLMNVYGFFTLPDTPLLFFTALFLWVYKRFLANPSYLVTLLLGLTMAGLMYSKYHAVLVILFVFLSNLKLVQNKKAWLAVLISLLAYTPHFVWLYKHNFVSINYHLFDRPNQAYSFTKFTLGYVLNLVVIFGLLFPWVYQALIKNRPHDSFTKALHYLTYGILLFFLISSFNRRVQTQWIIACSIPLAVITFNYLLKNTSTAKWVYRMGWISFVIVLYARLGLVFPELFPIHYESHGNKEWVSDLAEKSNNIPVVFDNSYGQASMYAFYSGNISYTLNNSRYRKSQYSIDSSEEHVRHKNIVHVTQYRSEGDISYMHGSGTIFYGNFIDDFESFRKLECDVAITPNSENQSVLRVYNPYPEDISLNKLAYGISFTDQYKGVKDIQKFTPIPKIKEQGFLKSMDTTYFYFDLPKSKMKKPSYFVVGIMENGLLPGLNSSVIPISQ